MKKQLLLLLMWVPFLAWAQFTQTVTTSPEFCAGDGKATVNISNTKVGASFDFVFYKLPNSTTPYRTATGIVAPSTSFTHTETNLPSGNYSLKTYENIGGVITEKTTSFSISNNFVALNFTNTVTMSCGKGTITANVTAGQPSTYELRKSSDNSLVAGPQTTNSFSNINPGTYNVIVTDKCGNKKSVSATIATETNNYVFLRNNVSTVGFNRLHDCTHYLHSIDIRRNGSSAIPADKFPIQFTYEVTGPGGTPITTLHYTMNSSADNGMEVTDIPFYYNQAFTIKASLVDACGNTTSTTDNIPARTIDMDILIPAASCGQSYLNIRPYLTVQPYTIEFINYPAGFKPWTLSPNFPNGSYTGTFTDISGAIIGNANQGVPNGLYNIKLTDACGHTVTKERNVTTDYILRNLDTRQGCGSKGGSSLSITANNNNQQVGDITALRIISGPTTFSSSYPVDISIQAILSNGQAIVGNLPSGAYVFEADSSCGAPRKVNITYMGANYNIDRTIAYTCGGFNLTATLSSNLYNPLMYLEHYNTANSTWEQVAIVPRPTPISNYAGTINNITKTGDFRIRFTYGTYIMGTTITCTELTEVFHVETKDLALNNYYVIQCSDNTYNLVVDTSGMEPLNYKIVEKDGVAISIDNGTDPVFTNLSEGNYKVEIADNCGNVKVFNTRVVANKLPRIKTSNLCSGQNGYLYVDGLSFLTIRWYKNGVDTGVTGNRYNFTPYNSTADAGLYEVVLTYEPNTNDCINNTISYTLSSANENNPSAGTGGTFTLNSSDVTGPIDLFTYLSGTYDTTGEWTETTNSGLLIDNKWYATLAQGGTYTFNYAVNGTCTGTDTSTVTIIFLKACYKYPVTDNSITVVSKHGITSLGRAGSADTDNWPMVRQSAYTVLESQTKGFVVNRLNTSQIQAITDAGNAVDGMMVYDTDADCLKVYVKDTVTPSNSGWHCFNTPACPKD